MVTSPDKVSIRTYHVGFGDCFLVSFHYADAGERHILVDFGSTGLPDGTPPSRMMDVAHDIRDRCGGKLHAVVATHRHKDHISGFATQSGGSGTGDVIRALRPDVVIQPWTEQPDLAVDATAPDAHQASALGFMQEVAAGALAEAARANFDAAVSGQLGFIGDDNLPNLSAVKNLMTMAPDGGARYVCFGGDAGLGAVLPGVDVRVLGPPTVDQSAAIRNEASKNKDEFWQFQALAMARGDSSAAGPGSASPVLFPSHVVKGPPYPVDTRWLIFHARARRGDQLLQIVRVLDEAMNNTSVILLFEIGDTLLLFPGDAQIENWSYALSKADVMAKLAKVNLYKVGHHGSLNATPKSLWKLFQHRSTDAHAPDRLVSLMSTMAGKHGHVEGHTEVPRSTLVTALKSETNLFTTEDLPAAGNFYFDEVLALPPKADPAGG
jgi:hypothetical protein